MNSEEQITDHKIAKLTVLSGFPSGNTDYRQDISEIMDNTIIRFGDTEWKLMVLTCEIHGHIGLYNVIGVKMGLYALEVMDAGHGMLSISSEAGSMPPLSCLNDGLQVSTGSSLGHGLISLDTSSSFNAAAQFRMYDKAIRLELKESYSSALKELINQTICHAGHLTPAYWMKIREEGIRIWQEFDRNEIFNIYTLNK